MVSPPDQPISFQAASGRGSVATISEYRGSRERRRPGRAVPYPSVARTTTSARTGPGGGAARPGRIRGPGGGLVVRPPEPLHPPGQAADQPGRVEGGAV